MANTITIYPYNILEDGTVTVTGTPDTGYPESRLYDRAISLYWKDTVTEAKTFHVDQGASGNVAVDFLAINRHNFDGEDMQWQWSENDVDWTDAVTDWTQGDNLQIVKTMGTELTKRYWRMTLSSMANPKCAEIFMSLGYSFSILHSPGPVGSKTSNVQWNRTVGGSERSTKFGNRRRRRAYQISLTAANLAILRTVLDFLDEMSKPFYIRDHEDNYIFCPVHWRSCRSVFVHAEDVHGPCIRRGALMRSVSAAVATVIDRLHVAPIRVVKIEFSGLTLYLCDRVWGDAGSEFVHDGQIYEPLILQWDTIQLGKLNLSNYEVAPGETNFVIDNSIGVGGAASFSALLPTYDPHYVKVTISEFFDDAYAAADAEIIFEGQIEDLLNMRTDSVTVLCSGYELTISNKFDHAIIDTETYSGADPDDYGKMLVQGYGSAKRVPFWAVDTGAISTILADITKTSTSVALSDASRFPSSGTIISGAEKMTWSSKSGNTLNGLGRASGGTTAAEHYAGDGVAEVKSEYVYALGKPVKAINDVYVGLVRQTGNYTAYTGQPGDVHASFPGMACIAFSGDKVNKKLREDVVSDTITTGPLATYSTSNDLPFSITIFDNGSSEAGWADIDDGGAYWTPSWESVNSDDGWIEEWGVSILVGFIGTAGTCDVWLDNLRGETTYLMRIDSGAFTVAPNNAPYFKAHSTTDYPVAEGRLAVSSNNPFDGFVVVSLTYVNVTLSNYTFKSTTTRTGSVNYSGNSTADTVIGGLVSADVQGFQDDGSGTYTGAAGALIERPGHVIKHFLIDRCGQTSDEINATSYAAADKIYFSRNHNMAPVILQKPSGRSFINRIATQAQSYEFWDGGQHRLIPVFKRYATNPDKTITAERIDLQQIWVQYTNRIDLLNTASSRFARDWSGFSDNIESDRNAINETEGTSVGKYGTLETDPRSYPYVTDQSHAQDVLAWEMHQKSRPRLLVELSGGYYFHDIERGDIVDFLFESGDELDRALLGLVTSNSDDLNVQGTQFQVIDQTRRPDGAIQLQMVEIDMIIEEYSNTDVDTGTETVDSFPDTDADCVFWDYLVKKSTNLRCGTIRAVWDVTNDLLEYTDQATPDVGAGDTSGLTLDVDISSNVVRLRATATSDDWAVKVLRRRL